MELSPRQVHLDFHTSGEIPGIGSDFNPEIFAKIFRDAFVSSVTVFGMCHHGWLYYPSKKHPELVHPHLKAPALLTEQVRALHKAGIKVPVYLTVQWNYAQSTTRPEWLIRKKDGSHEGDSFTEPGFYQSLCINTGYYNFLEEITTEVCQLLGNELDGLFFDIVGIRPCWCTSCRKEMKEKGIDAADDNAVLSFAKSSIDRFKSKLTAAARKNNENCTIFYNAGHVGPCTKTSKDAYTHFELESLPSGSWGYQHFPVAARYAQTLGKDCLGMTGKFHTEWGDFHSLKNQAALEFESFRMLSYGMACSIGDQLEPNGSLNPATYRLIGRVYQQFSEREAWARPSVRMAEAALVTPETSNGEFQIPDSIFGGAQMLEEIGLQFDIIDKDMDFSPYRLLILPDDLLVDPDFHNRIDRYVNNGGSVLATGQGGLSQGTFPSSFPVKWLEKQNIYPDFVIPERDMAKGLEEGTEYVVYLPGEQIEKKSGETILQARAPYFKREGDHFCSHRYTPSAKGDVYPAAVQNDRVIYFSHPLFSQYRKNAPLWCKRLVANGISRLLPQQLITHDGPSTLLATLLHQPEKSRFCIHLLSYIPVRKSADIDIIEERTQLNDVTLTLKLEKEIKSARLVPEDVKINLQENRITIPEIDGYAILEVNY